MTENWIKVSFCVKSAELAETIASLIADFIPGGVVIENTAPLFCVSAYLPVDDRLEERKRRLQEELGRLGQRQPIPEPAFEKIETENWATAWQKNYHPHSVGERFYIIPAWMDVSPGERIPIYLDPQATFGSGSHPTTQLTLELLEEYLDDVNSLPDSMLDLGCGSGILAIAMAKLGVDNILGVDVDQKAVDATSANAASNGVAGQISVGLGSVPEVLAGTYTLSHSPLVCANILAHILHKLFEQDLSEIVAPGGTLILAGMLEDQVTAIRAAIEKRNFAIV
ncbi:MAG: 50S ribosomal protein L11 methyltransferase, partial [Chloroflexota bacterium]|nr:50S ribosomal protein L11 methyltransferase [Chloroflexota bacterium]